MFPHCPICETSLVSCFSLPSSLRGWANNLVDDGKGGGMSLILIGWKLT